MGTGTLPGDKIWTSDRGTILRLSDGIVLLSGSCSVVTTEQERTKEEEEGDGEGEGGGKKDKSKKKRKEGV